MTKKRKFISYFKWKKKLLSRLNSKSSVIETKNGPVEYVMSGDEGPVLVVIHGAPGGFDQMTELFPDMENRGFRVLSWSRPGYLRTPLSVGKTIEEQSEVLAGLLDALNIDKVALTGISAGGIYALAFALRFPDRIWAILLESAVSHRYMLNPDNIMEYLFMQVMFNDFWIWIYSIFTDIFPKMSVKILIYMESNLKRKQRHALVENIMKDPKRVDVVYRNIRSIAPVSCRKEGFENDLLQLIDINRFPIEKISAPTLIVHGTNDADVLFHHPKYAAITIPNAELFLVIGGFHILSISDNADQITEKKIEFLKKHII